MTSPRRKTDSYPGAKVHRFCWLVVLVLAFGPTGVSGFNFRKEPGKTCLDCHVEKNVLLEKRFAHGPFATAPCETCHDPETVSLRAGGSDLCLGCHEPFKERLERNPVHHYPIQRHDCVACHEPHATDYPYSLRAAGASLCWMCHEDIQEQTDLVSRHQPFIEGKCEACHDPHSSTQEFLLTDTPRNLCLTQCHSYSDEELTRNHQGFDVTTQSCADCHHPHASRKQNLIRTENLHPPVGRGLCESCHTMQDDHLEFAIPEKIFCDGCHAGLLDREETRREQHIPFRKRQCRECHAPHGSHEFGMLRDRQPDACLTCHEDLRSVEERKSFHTPVTHQPCTTCHDAHASDYPGMLNRKESDLCFECHRSEPFQRVLFPHPPAEKGNCGFCHDGHGSDNPFLLKRTAAETCLKCHPEPNHSVDHPLFMETVAASGPVGATAPAEVRFSPSLDPYRESDGSYSCIACHEAHGGNRPAFLRRPIESGALCFECHSRRNSL